MAIDLGRLHSVLQTEPSRAKATVDEREGRVGSVDLTPAAVLFPIVVRESVASVLLTRRSDHLRDHPGQISFPGGRVEASDVSPACTALRETEEEIGLSPRSIEVLGYLPDYVTVTGFCVTPVVALVKPPFELRPDPVEVAEVFEVPLDFLMDSANHQSHSAVYRGVVRPYLAIPFQRHFIWGATAGIIGSLSRMMAG